MIGTLMVGKMRKLHEYVDFAIFCKRESNWAPILWNQATYANYLLECKSQSSKKLVFTFSLPSSFLVFQRHVHGNYIFRAESFLRVITFHWTDHILLTKQRVQNDVSINLVWKFLQCITSVVTVGRIVLLPKSIEKGVEKQITHNQSLLFWESLRARLVENYTRMSCLVRWYVDSPLTGFSTSRRSQPSGSAVAG